MPRTGRRPGRSGTRAKILAAARLQFAAHGYDRATIRGIARSARVDPKLVQHFFGSKHETFIAAMELPFDPTALLPPLVAVGVDGLGGRIVHTFVAVWDSPRGRPLVGLIRSVVANEDATKMMREFFTHGVLGGIGGLGIDDPRRRASLVASQLFGLALVRYILRLEPLASAPAAEVAAWMGPTLQRYLTADLSRGTTDAVARPLSDPVLASTSSGRGGRRRRASVSRGGRPLRRRSSRARTQGRSPMR